MDGARHAPAGTPGTGMVVLVRVRAFRMIVLVPGMILQFVFHDASNKERLSFPSVPALWKSAA
jgi:hypothetical protein